MPRLILPADLRDLRARYGFTSSNVLTLTNPKVLKSESIAPTAVLHLTPMFLGSCIAAGSCQAVCLNRAGNPAYLKGKLQRRKLRSLAFYDHPRAFKRLLILEILRFASKNAGAATLGLRLNGTSDFAWERETVEVDSELAGYVGQAFGFTLPVGTWSLFSLLRAVVPALKPYDYTKRVDRDWAAAARQGYHLTLSHGSKFDTLAKATELGLNYAAAITLPRSATLPETVVIDGQTYPTLDGDVTDWRPGDTAGQTHVVLLRIKRTPGQTEEQRRAFCIA